MTRKYTVIGAGHGGKAMAAHLALMGFKVTLYNRTPEHVEIIKKRGGIELESVEGGPHGFGKLALVTSRYRGGDQEQPKSSWWSCPPPRTRTLQRRLRLI